MELNRNITDSAISATSAISAEVVDVEPAESSQQPLHPVSDDQLYGSDRGGIVSYVVPPKEPELNIVDALDVVPEHQIITETAKKKRLTFFGGICLFVVVLLVVIVVIAVTLNRTPNKNSTGSVATDTNPSPTETPSQAPSAVLPTAPTIAPTTTSFGKFLTTLESHYDGTGQPFDAIFSDPTSPQYQAAKWAIDSAPTVGINENDDRMMNRFALATFYFSTNGDEWVHCGRRSTNCDVAEEWLTGRNECNWYAIECNDDGSQITKIFFPTRGESSNNIRGTLPYELSFLSSLTDFIISRGPISGTFPDWSKLTTLEKVIMNGNQFEGSFPTYLLEQNPFINTIQFNFNNFQGQFLQDLAEEASIALEDIGVNANTFTSPISPNIGKLSSLRILDIGSNRFTGTLPEEFYSLTNLLKLNLSDTKLTGEISTNIGAMSRLVDLNAAKTDMSGTLPTELFSLNQLQTLDLSFGNFSGPLSESFSSLTNLDTVKLNNNRFDGTITPSFEELPWLDTLELHSNDLSGSVPDELCDMEIRLLTVDCVGEEPEVTCECCMNCPQGV